MSEGQLRRVEDAVSPYLEPDEQVKAAFIGQTQVPPVVYLLVIPVVLALFIRRRTVVATDRHLYVFSNRWMRSYAYEGAPEKVAIENARLESGLMWGQAGVGPKLWVMPLGSGKQSFVELERVALELRSKRLWQGVQARDRGFGNTPM